MSEVGVEYLNLFGPRNSLIEIPSSDSKIFDISEVSQQRILFSSKMEAIMSRLLKTRLSSRNSCKVDKLTESINATFQLYLISCSWKETCRKRDVN